MLKLTGHLLESATSIESPDDPALTDRWLDGDTCATYPSR